MMEKNEEIDEVVFGKVGVGHFSHWNQSRSSMLAGKARRKAWSGHQGWEKREVESPRASLNM